MLTSIRKLLHCLRHDGRGNVFIIVAFAMVPMVFATGMGIDYSRAAKLRTKLNALADAAALSAVTRPMMDKSSTYAKQIATNTFSAQAARSAERRVGKECVSTGRTRWSPLH